MAKRSFRRGVGIATVLATAAAVGWVLRPTPIAVETTAAHRGSLTASVVAEGRTRVKDL